jgi:UDP:flavonoid glycosyltransferase YjiC (YdhE family)
MDFDFPWQELTGKPIVYASMGTLQNGLTNIFRSITQAAVGLKELQFVLAVGGQLDPKHLGDVSANVLVVNHAPQIEILKRSSLARRLFDGPHLDTAPLFSLALATPFVQSVP